MEQDRIFREHLKAHERIEEFYRNITEFLIKYNGRESKTAENEQKAVYNDSANAWLYILFVLMFYAFSIVVLMVKYIRRYKLIYCLEFYF